MVANFMYIYFCFPFIYSSFVGD